MEAAVDEADQGECGPVLKRVLPRRAVHAAGVRVQIPLRRCLSGTLEFWGPALVEENAPPSAAPWRIYRPPRFRPVSAGPVVDFCHVLKSIAQAVALSRRV